MVLNKSGILALVASFVPTLQTTSFVWDLDPNPTVSDVDAAIVTLRVKTLGSNGVAETRYTYDVGGQALSYQEVGNRDLLLDIRCETYDLSVEPSEILDQIRIGFHGPTVIDSMTALVLAWQSCGQTIDISHTFQNRYINMAMMEVRLSALGQGPVTGIQWVQTVDSATNGQIPGTIS